MWKTHFFVKRSRTENFQCENFLGQLPTVISELRSRIYIVKSAILIFFSVSLDFFAWNFYHCETTFEIGSIAPQIWHLVVCRFRIYVIRIFYCPYCSLNSTNNGGSLFLDLDSLASASSGWRVTRSFRPNFSASTTWLSSKALKTGSKESLANKGVCPQLVVWETCVSSEFILTEFRKSRNAGGTRNAVDGVSFRGGETTSWESKELLMFVMFSCRRGIKATGLLGDIWNLDCEVWSPWVV